jgi:hypothetical protein
MANRHATVINHDLGGSFSPISGTKVAVNSGVCAAAALR